MVEISQSGSGEGPGRATAPGYSTTLPGRAPARPSASVPRFARLSSSERTPQQSPQTRGFTTSPASSRR
jgi:hypothetical protein